MVLELNTNYNIMKKLLVILLMGSSLISFGQHEGKQKRMSQEFSPEQNAILKTKKMALALDLNQSQQKQMLELNKKWAEEKASKRAEMKSLNKEEMSSTDRFNQMNTMLDKKLAHQNELKKVLNEEQYKSWKMYSSKMHYKLKKRGEAQHMKHRINQKY